MLGCALAEVLQDPVAAAGALQARYGGTVVLKGAVSVIHDGVATALNLVGSPALAKGGSGDALTGIIAALLAESPGLPHGNRPNSLPVAGPGRPGSGKALRRPRP